MGGQPLQRPLDAPFRGPGVVGRQIGTGMQALRLLRQHAGDRGEAAIGLRLPGAETPPGAECDGGEHAEQAVLDEHRGGDLRLRPRSGRGNSF